MPAVIVDVFISNVSSSLSFWVTSKKSEPLVSFNASCLLSFVNSALLSAWRVMILVSSRFTDARLPAPVINASPDWNLAFFLSCLSLPPSCSTLTVPSALTSFMVFARYVLRLKIITQTITIIMLTPRSA